MKTKLIKIFAIFALLTSSTVVYSASFDCRKAKSVNEHLTCQDEELSRLDDELGIIYKDALLKSDNPKQLASNQTASWTKREKECSEKPCLIEWYSQRKNFLATGAISAIKTKDKTPSNKNDTQKVRQTDVFPTRVKKHESYKPFTITSSKLGKEMSDVYIANKFLCKTPMEVLQETMNLLKNYDLVDSSNGDGTLTITSFSGMQQAKNVVVSLAIDEHSNPRIVRYILVEGIPALYCQ